MQIEEHIVAVAVAVGFEGSDGSGPVDALVYLARGNVLRLTTAREVELEQAIGAMRHDYRRREVLGLDLELAVSELWRDYRRRVVLGMGPAGAAALDEQFTLAESR